jgi:hypothetical protein
MSLGKQGHGGCDPIEILSPANAKLAPIAAQDNFARAL